MPVGPLNFRPICGGFLWIFQHFMSRRAKQARESAVNTVKLRSMRLSLALLILVATLLQQAGDVESNPGPGNNKNKRQSHLQASNGRISVEESPGVERSANQGEKDPQQTEPSLSSLLEAVTTMKQDLTDQISSVNGRLDSLNDSVTGLRHEINQLSDTVNFLKQVS